MLQNPINNGCLCILEQRTQFYFDEIQQLPNRILSGKKKEQYLYTCQDSMIILTMVDPFNLVNWEVVYWLLILHFDDYPCYMDQLKLSK